MTSRRALLQGLGLLALSPALLAWRSNEALFAPSAEEIDFWAAETGGEAEEPDFSAWSAWLSRQVRLGPDGVARIDYGGVTGEEKQALAAIIDDWSYLTPRALPREVQMAFWINLYNALTVKVVLDHYPVESIRKINISPGFFSSGPWDAELLEIEERPVTLNEIEHGILRPLWRDPRIHYAVNCASIGCPNLRAEAYLPERLEEQLDEQARAYVRDPRGLSFGREGPIVSRIYDWFIEDFGDSEEGVMRHLLSYASDEQAEQLRQWGELGGTAYDWRLNDLATAG
jgi:hypothetical protein